MNPDAVNAAIVAAINATYTSPRAFSPKDAKTSTLTSKMVVRTHPTSTPTVTLSGETTVDTWRTLINYEGASDTQVGLFRERVFDVLRGNLIAFGADHLGPFTFETAVITEEVDGAYQGADSFTF